MILHPALFLLRRYTERDAAINKKPPSRLSRDRGFLNYTCSIYCLATSNLRNIEFTLLCISFFDKLRLFTSSVVQPCQMVLSVLASTMVMVSVPSLTWVV